MYRKFISHITQVQVDRYTEKLYLTLKSGKLTDIQTTSILPFTVAI